MEKYLSYFNEMCKEDVEDVTTICEVASKEIYEKFKTKFDDPKLLAATFSKIYEAIEAKLKSYQSGENGYSDFQINLCDRLVIGYSTNDDDDDEKKGNFMIYLRHMNSNRRRKNVMIQQQQVKKEQYSGIRITSLISQRLLQRFL